VEFPLPALAPDGPWTLTAQELLTGLTAECRLEPGAAAVAPTTVAVGNVHTVQPDALAAFAKRPGEKLVIVDLGQEAYLPLAQKLAEALQAAGGAARVWALKPEDFDTIPIRWYPRGPELASLAEIDAGRLVGYRKSLEPYVDLKRGVHYPARGGYAEIDPPFMVGRDCVVFSGGKLAESLRAVTPWMGTPNVPGRGQGRLVATFSPFMADRMAVAVVANDAAGMAAAADALAAIVKAGGPAAAPAAGVVAAAGAWHDLAPVKSETRSVARPYQQYAPLRRVRRLLAASNGKSAVVLEGKKDTVVLVAEDGTITGSAAVEVAAPASACIDQQGRFWFHTTVSTAENPGWRFSTACELSLHGVGADGRVVQEGVVYSGARDEMAAGWKLEQAYVVAPDGRTAFLGRLGGARCGVLGDPAMAWLDDAPLLRYSFEAWAPRSPIGVAFAPDSRTVVRTMATTPVGYGAMNSQAWNPCGADTALMDARTGERLWTLRAPAPRSSAYAVHGGFSAVSEGGAVTLLADHDSTVWLVGRDGKVLASKAFGREGVRASGPRQGPLDGVGVWLNRTGTLGVVGFKDKVVLIADKVIGAPLPVESLVSACVADDGSFAVLATEVGEVRAVAPDGTVRWTFAAGGVSPQVAAVGPNGVLVATSPGESVRLDGKGQVAWRTAVAAHADRERHELQRAADAVALPAPLDYRDPGTLALAQARLKAARVAQWQPADAGRAAFGRTFYPLAAPLDYRDPGTLALAQARLKAARVAQWQPADAGRAAFGRTFYPLAAPLELTAPADAAAAFVHLVYCKAEATKAVTVATRAGRTAEEFVLDLPTPEFRVVDIPVFGGGAAVTVKADGAAEVAECSLWSFQWSGANLAYVAPADSPGGELGADAGKQEEADGIMMELGESDAISGKMKECRIWYRNPSVDNIGGAWLPPGVNPLVVADGRRFGNGKLSAWTDKVFQGAWWAVDFGQPVAATLVVTYDRANRQSEVAATIAVIQAQADPTEPSRVLAAALGNDQFWRLLPLKPEPMRLYGVHTRTPAAPCGLSEVELYR
jgi:hypothetical protein